MRIDSIQIGNSKGIRLPRSILETCHFEDAVELEVKKDMVILHRLQKKPRTNWGKSFKRMATAGDDGLVDQPTGTRWVETVWQW